MLLAVYATVDTSLVLVHSEARCNLGFQLNTQIFYGAALSQPALSPVIALTPTGSRRLSKVYNPSR